jgi:chitodextrinase
VYGRVRVPGITDAGGSPDLIGAQLGWGATAERATWHWVDATYNAGHGGDDLYEYMATFSPGAAGTYSYGYRFSTDGGSSWTDATPTGAAHIAPPADTTAPAAPTGLHVAGVGPTAIGLAWDANGEPDLFGYRIERSDGMVATSTAPSFTDTTVATGTTYTYVVRAVDTSANVSDPSASVTATAQLRTVHVVFTVTVPSWTPADKTVWMAGTFAQLGLVDWDDGHIVELAPVGGNQWRVTVDAPESTFLEYKYTLGSWDYVEKGDGGCNELGNRSVVVAYGATGTQNVADTVANWRNVAPCGS